MKRLGVQLLLQPRNIILGIYRMCLNTQSSFKPLQRQLPDITHQSNPRNRKKKDSPRRHKDSKHQSDCSSVHNNNNNNTPHCSLQACFARPRLPWFAVCVAAPSRAVSPFTARFKSSVAIEEEVCVPTLKPPFKKILAANRGEIATRINRAGAELGAITAGIYSYEGTLFHFYESD